MKTIFSPQMSPDFAELCYERDARTSFVFSKEFKVKVVFEALKKIYL